MKRLLGIILVVIFVLLALQKINKTEDKKNPINNVKTETSIRLKWLNQSQFAGLYFAKEKGLYEKFGLDVEIRERDFNAVTPLTELLSGKTDFIIINASELIVERSKGAEIIAVAAFFQESPAVIVALEDSKIVSPRDFRGKTLGIVSDSDYSKFIYRDLMSQYGLTDSDVFYQVVGSDQADNLINGNVDLISIYRTEGYDGFSNRGKRYKFFKPEEYGTKLYDDVLVTSIKNIKERPEIVKSFVSASILGWEGVVEHQNEANKIVYKYANKRYKNANYLSDSLYQVTNLVKLNDEQKIGEMNSLGWNIIKNKLDAQGILVNPVSVEDLFTNSFLN